MGIKAYCGRLLLCAVAVASAAGGDELSGADKLRVLWSNQFAWTRDNLPLVTVRIVEGKEELAIAGKAGELAVLPDGEGGAEVRGGANWTVRLDGAGHPAKVRWHVVVARAAPQSAESLQPLAATWRERGFAPHTFEVGSVFGIRGNVIDGRQLLLCVAPSDDESAAKAQAKSLGEKFHFDATLHPEVLERSRGTLVARDEKGAVVRNDSVIWFASDGAPIGVTPADRNGGKRSYAGQVYVTVDSHGKLAAVNAVPEDKLLAGLLPAEMGVSAPPEALKAQAVAARNELLAKIGTRHLTDPYRLCSDVHCQVYAGAGSEDPRTTAAVTATRGELLTRSDGTLVDAVYSASCGGHTEDNDLAWGGTADPSLRGKLDADDEATRALAKFSTVASAADFLGPLPAKPYCAAAKGAAAFRWTSSIPVATIEAANPAIGNFQEMRVVTRGVSGRVVKLVLVGSKGEKEIEGELTIRRALGNLKSSLFEFSIAREGKRAVSVSFTGGGHGHGIGMCQSGAMGMAESGKSYKEILQHYYRSATVRKLY
jgi:SpoIID/LytB domain protein